MNQRRPSSLNSAWFIRISLSFMPMNSTSLCCFMVKSSPFLKFTCFCFLISLKSFSSIPFKISGNLIVANTRASCLFSGLLSTVRKNSDCLSFIVLARETECFLSRISLFCWRQIDLALDLFYSSLDFRLSYLICLSSASIKALISSVFAISSIFAELIKHLPSLYAALYWSTSFLDNSVFLASISIMLDLCLNRS